DARPPGRAPQVLQYGLDGFGAAVREEAAVAVVGHAGDERFGEEARKRTAFHLHEVGERAVHRVPKCLLDRRMTPSEGEHAEAGEEIEVATAGAVVEVRALGAHIVGVESDRAEDAGHLRIYVALVERERFRSARREQRADVEWLDVVRGGRRSVH